MQRLLRPMSNTNIHGLHGWPFYALDASQGTPLQGLTFHRRNTWTKYFRQRQSLRLPHKSWYKSRKMYVVSFHHETCIQKHTDLQEAIKMTQALQKCSQVRLILK